MTLICLSQSEMLSMWWGGCRRSEGTRQSIHHTKPLEAIHICQLTPGGAGRQLLSAFLSKGCAHIVAAIVLCHSEPLCFAVKEIKIQRSRDTCQES